MLCLYNLLNKVSVAAVDLSHVWVFLPDQALSRCDTLEWCNLLFYLIDQLCIEHAWDVLFEHAYYCVVAEEEPTSGASNTGEG